MRNAYNFTTGEYGDKFTFTSTGSKGNVRKAVIFEMEEDGLYSIVMGDLTDKDNLLSFKPTGNSDAKKVLATVADIIEFFIQQKPKAIVFMTGTSQRLTNLYKELLLQEINLPEGYIKEGVKADNTCEPIDPNKDYEGFFVFRKE
ncbi:MAG: hypothetical protein JWQ09_1819 [Segetibacter sp.]|nr:hypothetical protein [Segetibacter sp.]